MNRYNFADSISQGLNSVFGTISQTTNTALQYKQTKAQENIVNQRKEEAKKKSEQYAAGKDADRALDVYQQFSDLSGAELEAANQYYEANRPNEDVLNTLIEKYGEEGGQKYMDMLNKKVSDSAYEYITSARARTGGLIDPSGASTLQEVQGIQAVNSGLLEDIDRKQLSEQWSQMGRQLKSMKKGGFNTPAEMFRAEQANKKSDPEATFEYFESLFPKEDK